MIIKEQITQHILEGGFKKAESLFLENNVESLQDILKDIAFNKQNITAYSFILYLLYKKETLELHLLAITIMAGQFCYIDGSYATALFHARRMIELAPDNADFIHELLFFNAIPEKLVSDEEAAAIRTLLEKMNYKPS